MAQDGSAFIRIDERDVAELNLLSQRREVASISLFGNLRSFVHNFPDITRRRQRQLHRILEPRKFAHRIVAAKQEEEKSQELGGIHACRCDLALSEEK